MSLPGQFSVNPAGAATYSIPISVPPGAAGMSPSLSLNYNSQGGNSLLGVGWSLGGLSSIGRCPQTVAQDGAIRPVFFDSNDRFCLDGRRLVVVTGSYGADGAEYRTEIDTYSKIISHGTVGTGPAWFEVHTKSGQTLEYGHSADSQIMAQAKSSVGIWAQNKVTDPKSNYYTIAYTNDTTNGQFYSSRIDYTGNATTGMAPYNSVQFVYADRPDKPPRFQAGSMTRVTVRLTNVRTFIRSSLVSDYRLTYQDSGFVRASYLSAVGLCAADGTCLPPLSLSVTSPETGGFDPVGVYPIPSGNVFGSSPTGSYTLVVGDFSGDGKTDYALIGSNAQYVFLSKGDGTFLEKDTGGLPNVFGTPPSNSYALVVQDFTGDGKMDYAFIGTNAQYVFISNGDGTFSERDSIIPNGWSFGTPPTITYDVVTGDFNGDGRGDYALIGNNGRWVFLSNGDGTFAATGEYPLTNGWSFGSPPRASYDVITGDFNGDGRGDYALLGSAGRWVYLSNGDGTFTPTGEVPLSNGWAFGSPPRAAYAVVTGDFNGDRLGDYALIGTNSQYVYLSKGDGTFLPVGTYPIPNGWAFGSPPTGSYSVTYGDFNGDGCTDYALLGNNGQWVFLSNGDGTFSQTGTLPLPNGWAFGSPPSTSYALVTGDLNGDGRGDYALIGSNSQYSYLSSGQPFYLVSSISSGIGAQTSITYQSTATASAPYQKGTDASYPIVDLQVPINVVTRVDVSNGVGGALSSTYSYAGAKADLSGRGMLGFRQMTMQDLQTGISKTTSYQQNFPFTGAVSSVTSSLSSQTISQKSFSYQATSTVFISGQPQTVSWPTGSPPYSVQLSQTVSSGSDLDGSTLPSVTSSSQYDAYGNATQVAVSTSDGFSKTTMNTYSNDPSLWYLGRLTRASATSVAP
ncbi:hypothetical protein BRAS3843_1640017 [Bradyrhizobium sp. STM 3843]|nr:hypothetical protein BRAS3843_1640017 [Bradyrhizobium sp. STM 3843]